jgi:hypothetical protein
MSKVFTLTEPNYSAIVESMSKTREDADGTRYLLVRPIRTARKSGFWAKESDLKPFTAK